MHCFPSKIDRLSHNNDYHPCTRTMSSQPFTCTDSHDNNIIHHTGVDAFQNQQAKTLTRFVYFSTSTTILVQAA